MSQQVQELIEKIKTEGMRAADQKAREIEQQAQKNALKIIEEAKHEAQQVIARAKQETQKIQTSAQTSLKQASRDMLISLRKEIGRILQRIVAAKVSDVLTTQNLASLITEVVKKAVEGNPAGLDVSVSAKDLQELQEGFLAQLQKEIKKPILLKASDDIGKGFVISFDQGKSNFDFTDVGLADYLGSYLNEQVAALLKEAAQ
jgi:V/A-type H+-transporting ATPase subunit E